VEAFLYRLDVCGRIINVVMKGRAVVTVLGTREFDVEKEPGVAHAMLFSIPNRFFPSYKERTEAHQKAVSG
jgi:hypothetical protein